MMYQSQAGNQVMKTSCWISVKAYWWNEKRVFIWKHFETVKNESKTKRKRVLGQIKHSYTYTTITTK